MEPMDETPAANFHIFLPTGTGDFEVDESLIPPGKEPGIYPAENGLNLPGVLGPEFDAGKQPESR